MTLRVALVGASGRMGQAIARIARDEGIDVVASVSKGDDLALATKAGAHAAIDFSTPETSAAFAAVAASARLPIVVGTTGLAAEQQRALDQAAQAVAVFVSSNMSVGVYVLGQLVAQAATMLGAGFDIEIVEAHHKKKVDAPSGTALTLLDLAKKAAAAEGATSFGRSGRPGARPAGEIGVHAVRGGDVVGDHHVHFLGEGERLELTHRATHRDVFARGALRAAGWIVGKPAGRYGMPDLFT